MRVLFVCTANICRSPSAEALASRALAHRPALSDIEVRSAGTHAIAGSPACRMAPALAGGTQHRSVVLDADVIDWADLILTAERAHASVVVSTTPRARARTFTMRRAGGIAAWLHEAGMVQAARERALSPPASAGEEPWSDRFAVGDPRRTVEPLPSDRAGRYAWVVGELDAGRSAVSFEGPEQPEGRSGGWWARRGRGWRERELALLAQGEDVVDPHVHGDELHDLSFEMIQGAVVPLVELLAEVQG